jgi:hypothetical protein
VDIFPSMQLLIVALPSYRLIECQADATIALLKIAGIVVFC